MSTVDHGSDLLFPFDPFLTSPPPALTLLVRVDFEIGRDVLLVTAEGEFEDGGGRERGALMDIDDDIPPPPPPPPTSKSISDSSISNDAGIAGGSLSFKSSSASPNSCLLK